PCANVYHTLLYSSLLRPALSTHFPYTTLFRSEHLAVQEEQRRQRLTLRGLAHPALLHQPREERPHFHVAHLRGMPQPVEPHVARSEEHTSELQSRENLVCRLLLEKKNRDPLSN